MQKWSWEKYVEAVAKYPFEYPWKRYLCIAQAIIESGRGTTELAKNHGNFNGMKYRKSVSQYGGKPFEYFTDSEPRKPDGSQGSDIFFEFTNYEDSVKTWDHRFEINENGWMPYSKVVAKDPEVMQDLESFLSYIAPIYCPYWDKEKHGNLSYSEYIVQKCLPEAKKLIDNIQIVSEVSWFEFNRYDSGSPSVMGYAGEQPKVEYKENSTKGLISFLNSHPNAKTFLVADTKKPIPKIEPEIIIPNGKRVLLDPGHSERKPGARGISSSVQEEDLNRLQAKILKGYLATYGIIADIYDPIEDDLYEIGKKAKGYHAFISLHLNATNRKEHYTCAMCHSRLQSPNSRSAKVASQWAIDIGVAINNPIFSGSAGWPKGVMAAGLSVLNGAAQTDCPIFFLSEMEFVDDEVTLEGITTRIEVAMKAGARVMAQNI